MATHQEMEAKLTEAMAKQPALSRVNAPTFYGSSIQASWSSNELSLTIGRSVPSVIDDGEMKGTMIGVIEPQLIVSMSPQTAKDLLLLLIDGISSHEERFGEIVTEFSASRKA